MVLLLPIKCVRWIDMNTSGTLPRYSEVFIDDGYVDMKRAMSIYERCGFAGTVIPDHTPRLDAADR